jgi:hypothetical protein
MLSKINFPCLFLLALVIQTEALAANVTATDMQPLPVQTEQPVLEKETVHQPSSSSSSIRDAHFDYRYCLELKSNKEIAECAYKSR